MSIDVVFHTLNRYLWFFLFIAGKAALLVKCYMNNIVWLITIVGVFSFAAKDSIEFQCLQD